MVFESRKLFPVRLFGFSMFWAWLFLVAVSPSPAFGQLYGLSGAPFEIPELLFRVLALGIVFARARLGERDRKAHSARYFDRCRNGRSGTSRCQLLPSRNNRCLCPCRISGSVHVPHVAVLLRLYAPRRNAEAHRSLLCRRLDHLSRNERIASEAAIAIAALLPIASGLSFLLSERHYQAQRGSELFVDIPSTQKHFLACPTLFGS